MAGGLSAGKVQEKGEGVTHRFRSQHHPVPRLWPWSESETGRLGAGQPFPQGNVIGNPLYRSSHKRTIWKN
jgi:hypothetical protein